MIGVNPIEEKIVQILVDRIDHFRNIAIHDYQKLNLDILKQILDLHLDDFRIYAKVMSQFNGSDHS